MEPVPPSRGSIRFGAFEVDLRTGEVVTREELQKRIWPADTFVDFDHGLYSAVQRLRDALSDNAETPRYVETLPRRGYRFIASVHHENGIEAKVETASV